MSTFEPASVQPGPFGRALYRISVVVAVFGGLSLLGIMLLTVASVVGRELFGSPIPGDFEMVEIWCAVSVFAFLLVSPLAIASPQSATQIKYFETNIRPALVK